MGTISNTCLERLLRERHRIHLFAVIDTPMVGIDVNSMIHHISNCLLSRQANQEVAPLLAYDKFDVQLLPENDGRTAVVIG